MREALSAADVLARHVGGGVHLIDTHYMRPGLAASHLLVDDGRAAFIDTGPAPSAPRLLGALDELGIDRSQVDYVILTHVHLDHAGGAGQLIAALPNARAVLHPRGAPHVVDPSKLIAGSIEVYGREPFERMYGEILPIPQERVLVSHDGMQLTVGKRRLEFIDTPGHARHHHSIIDLDARDIYSGDTFGVSYRDFDTVRGPFILPTTTPVQFDPDALHASIDRLMDYRPKRMVLMHFGPVQDLERLARELHASIVEFVRIARRHADASNRSARIAEDMFRHLSVRLDAHGYTGDLARRRELLSDDVTLNTQGLVVWLNRT